MNFLPKFLLRIAKTAHSSEEGSGIMSIIIRQPYAHLEKELRSAFKGEKDVKVIVVKRRDILRVNRRILLRVGADEWAV